MEDNFTKIRESLEKENKRRKIQVHDKLILGTRSKIHNSSESPKNL